MFNEVVVYGSGVLLLIGALFTLLAAVGVLRFPDLYTRMHAASKAGAVGGGLILLVVALMSQDASIAIRAIIGIVFLLLTTPVSAHLLAKASLGAGYKPWGETVADETVTIASNRPVAE
ncbi:monovalent cation/H(+) antiporter subunit G [Devosia rhizoryzae]|uniref:Monovalent cation/H(+) antiporter subunit G n=1 Tax=Devosia rhizoryzae TaxID=2774137 RepID=A0ABX7CD82_9HYPH|nr:monovalent cation/H(+) antiporter subunit G [Devosia rhizoryzae]QQR41169.1 monovalent cation/H(+) antiporter subunit G [Devosia rhizoryzae]